LGDQSLPPSSHGGMPAEFLLVSRLANIVIMRRDTRSLFSVACWSLKCEGIQGQDTSKADDA